MRITKLRVEQLFGIFKHNVSMNLDDRITIIHGPNGYGKTTILKLVDGLFGGRYSELRNTEFKTFSVTFDDDRRISVTRRRKGKGRNEAYNLEITLHRAKGSESQQVTLSPMSPSDMGVPASYIEHTLPFVRQVGEATFLDRRTGEQLSLEEITDLFPNHLPRNIGHLASIREPDWLTAIRKSVKVRFIESQRLLRLGKRREPRDEEEAVRPAVTVYARELSKRIQEKLAEYGTLSQSLDRSFPKRLVEQVRNGHDKQPSADELKDKLQQLEEKRVRLTEAGLLDKDYEQYELGNYTLEPTLTSSVLPVYVSDVEQKLTVFNEIAQKIEALRQVVNARFQYKTMSISKEKGFEFFTQYPGVPAIRLSPSHLSSGEQHMLVLLYELLFTVEPNSLIMIDEPEISLHVAWQLEFLINLKRITELASIDVLIATHAPGIINDRWDLTQELKAPTEPK